MKHSPSKIYLFTEDVAQKVSNISNMPSCIADSYFPACAQLYAKHMASGLIAPGEVTEIRSVSEEELSIEDIGFDSISSLLSGNVNVSSTAEAVRLPMLVGNRFELVTLKDQVDIPETLRPIVKMHEKELVWIRKDIYRTLFDSARRGEPLPYSPYRIESDEQNVNSVVYVLKLL